VVGVMDGVRCTTRAMAAARAMGMDRSNST
jgi:hypothetical protein